MPKVIHDPGALLGFHEVLEGRGYAAISRVLSMCERKAWHEIAQALHVKRNTPVLELRRLRCLQETPVSYDVSYFPIDIGAKLVSEDLARDIFPLLESRCKVALGRAEVRVEALACDADTAAILELEVGAPVLYLRRMTANSQGRPIDYEHLYCRGDAWQYRLELTRRSRP
jgi:GntR family transcriptional regulator